MLPGREYREQVAFSFSTRCGDEWSASIRNIEQLAEPKIISEPRKGFLPRISTASPAVTSPTRMDARRTERGAKWPNPNLGSLGLNLQLGAKKDGLGDSLNMGIV